MILAIAFSLCFAVGFSAIADAVAATEGARLVAQAAALETAGKYQEAGNAYHTARDAFMKEENYDAAGKALGKLTEMLSHEIASAQPPVTPTPAPLAKTAADAVVAAPAATTKTVELPPLAPQTGRLVGRVVDELGGAVPGFTLKYSGFEDGKLINNNSENVGASMKGTGGEYSIKVPPGAYRVATYVTYVYQGRTYNFEAEPLNPPARHDLGGLGLDYLKAGLVRDFVLKMTAKKRGAWETSESGYLTAYYGGRVDIDCEHFAAGSGAPPPLWSTLGKHPYPADSRVHVTLTPQGPMVDGSTGHVVEINLRLGDNGLYQQCQRGVFPGQYVATAFLTTPTGETVPLRLSRKGTPDGKDPNAMEWKSSVLVDFVPNDLGLKTPMGVRAFGLFPAL